MKKVVWWTVPFLSLAFISLVIVGVYQILSQKRTSPLPLTIMSFNIRYDNPGDGENAWSHRMGMVAGTIRFHKIEIVGIQEALHNQVVDLESMLPEHSWFGVGRDDGRKAGEYSPIFFQEKRFKVLDQSTFWLSETPDIPGNLGWDAVCPRIVTWGKFKDRGTEEVFFVFNTHFDHVGEKAREESASFLLLKINELAGDNPIVLTGDFNCTTDSQPYFILTQNQRGFPCLTDAYDVSRTKHYGSIQTFNGFTDELRPGFRIDFIFIRNIHNVLRHGVISEKWNGRFASDHYPVLTEISLSE